MPGPPTTRRGLPTLDETTRSDAPDVPTHINNLAEALDDAPTDMSGLASVRPANPGKDAVWYFATDTGVLSRYRVGAGWATVTPRDAAADVPSLRTLGTGSAQAVSNLDGRLSDQRIPQNLSVTLDKMAVGVGSRLLNVQTLTSYFLNGAQQTYVLTNTAIFHNNKPGVAILLHSFRAPPSNSGNGALTARLWRDDVDVSDVTYGAVGPGESGLALKVYNFGALSGSHNWKVRVDSIVPGSIYGDGHGILAIFEQY